MFLEGNHMEYKSKELLDGKNLVDDNIAKYIGRIRDKLMLCIPSSAATNTIDIASILEKHLEEAVIETLKDVIPSSSLNDLREDVVETVKETARYMFLRNKFLLRQKFPGELDIIPKHTDKDTKIQHNPQVPPNSNESSAWSRKTSESSVREEDEKVVGLFNEAAKMRDKAKTEQTIQRVDSSDLKTDLNRNTNIKSSATSWKSSAIRKIKEMADSKYLAKEIANEAKWHGEHIPDICAFLTVEKLAENLVDNVIKLSKDMVAKYNSNVEKIILRGSVAVLQVEPSEKSMEFVEAYGSFVSWPKISEFNIEMGAENISEYMATWYYAENWLYDIDMILAQSDSCSDFYIYEVKWGIPTQEFPVPQATASVFFTIEVSRVLPTDCYVNVTYQFEGTGYIHEPFKHTFQEKWLFNIIEAKLRFCKTLTF